MLVLSDTHWIPIICTLSLVLVPFTILYEICRQGVIIVVFNTMHMYVFLNTNTMIPCRHDSELQGTITWYKITPCQDTLGKKVALFWIPQHITCIHARCDFVQCDRKLQIKRPVWDIDSPGLIPGSIPGRIGYKLKSLDCNFHELNLLLDSLEVNS